MEIGTIEFVEKGGLLVPKDKEVKIPDPKWIDTHVELHQLGSRVLLASLVPDETWLVGDTVRPHADLNWHFDRGRKMLSLANLSLNNQRGSTDWISLMHAVRALSSRDPAFLNGFPEGILDPDREDLLEDRFNLLLKVETALGQCRTLKAQDGVIQVDWTVAPHSVAVFNNAFGVHKSGFARFQDESAIHDPQNFLYRNWH